MKRMRRASLLALLMFVTTTAQGQVTWDWAFGSNSGQFVTDGTAPGGIAAPGVYTLTDFLVQSSGEGATIGSWLGGQYSASGFGTEPPYTFTWDGTAVTFWGHQGSNTFDWIVFDELATSRYFFFGWQSTNINTVDHAAYYNNDISDPSYTLTVEVADSPDATVPEPATMTLVATGLAGLAASRRRRRT